MQKKINVNLLKQAFKGITVVMLLVFAIPAFAEKSTVNTTVAIENITGTVVDETDLPLPGVTVKVKNTNIATSTDVKGHFSINADRGAVLVFSFIGYLNQEATYDGSALRIKLKPSANMLNEVVAIGYQTMRKSDVTGAISSVKASELNLVAPTVGQALVGKVAGDTGITNQWRPIPKHQDPCAWRRFVYCQLRPALCY